MIPNVAGRLERVLVSKLMQALVLMVAGGAALHGVYPLSLL